MRSLVLCALLSAALALPLCRAAAAADLGVVWSQAGHRTGVSTIRWVTGEDKMLTCASDVRAWRASDGRLLQVLPWQSTVLSADGHTYAAATGSNLEIHRTSDGQLLHTLTGHAGPVYCVAFSQDGQTIATGSADSTIKLWRASDGGYITTFFNQSGGVVYQLAFSPSGDALAASHSTGGVIRAVPSGQIIHQLGLSTTVPPVFCLGGSAIATCGSYYDSSTYKHVFWISVTRVSDGQQLWSFDDHTSDITQLATTADGATLISSSYDGTLKFWALNTGKLLNTIESPTTGLSAFALSPNEQEILSGGNDGALLLWKTAPPAASRTLSGHVGAVAGVAVSRDGRYIATVSWDSTVKIWDAANGGLVKSLEGHVSEVYSCAFSPDSHLLATAGYDGIVRVWRTGDWQVQNALVGHTEAVLTVAFSPDGQRLASAGWDRTVKLWRVSDGQLQRTITGHTGEIYSVAFSPDGQQVASAGYDGAKLWQISGSYFQNYAGSSRAVTFTPGGTLVIGYPNGRIRVGMTGDGFDLLTQIGGIASLAVSPNGKYLYAAGSVGSVGKWRLSDRQYLGQLSGHTGPVTSIALDRDGRTLVSGSWDNDARVWHLSDSFVRPFAHNREVTAVGFGPDGRTVLTCSQDSRLLRWNVYNGLILGGGPQAHDGGVTCLALSHGRSLILTGGTDGTARLWRQRDLSLVIAIPAHTGAVNAVAVSPDALTAATAGGDRLVKLWDTGTGALLKSLTGHTAAVNALAVTPDGQYLVSGGADNLIKVWRLSDRTLYRTLTGHAAAVTNIAFSLDGLVLASGSTDGVLKVWKTATWQVSRTQSAHTSAVTALSFTPDSAALATAGQDKAVRFWKASDGASLGEYSRQSVVSDLQFSPDGALMALGHQDASIAVAFSPVSAPLLGNRLKLFEDASQLTANGLVVSRVFPGFFYAQQPDRSSGIRIVGASSAAEGDVINVTGALATSADGERFLQMSAMSTAGNAPARPLAMSLSALGGGPFAVSPGFTGGQAAVSGGIGLNNIGLLVRCTARVGAVDTAAQTFVLAHNPADTEALRVQVSAPGLALPPTGAMVSVTGISSCYRDGQEIRSVLRVASESDIAVLGSTYQGFGRGTYGGVP